MSPCLILSAWIIDNGASEDKQSTVKMDIAKLVFQSVELETRIIAKSMYIFEKIYEYFA